MKTEELFRTWVLGPVFYNLCALKRFQYIYLERKSHHEHYNLWNWLYTTLDEGGVKSCMFRLCITTIIRLCISEVRVEEKHKITFIHSIIKLKGEITCLHNYLWASHLGNVSKTCNRILKSTGLFQLIVGVLTTCDTQCTWNRSICVFLFNRTTLQVFVTYLTGVLYVHPLWFYKHQHDNGVRSKLFVACQRWWFQWRFWFVPLVPGYTRILSLETVHTSFEWNCQMVVVSRIFCGIAAGQLYPDNHSE